MKPVKNLDPRGRRGPRPNFRQRRAGPGDWNRPSMRSFSAPTPPTRDIASDRPGRKGAASAGTAHGATPRIDWHRFEKHRFAAEMAEVVNRAAAKKAFDRLVLVAPPEPLGALRNRLNPAVRRQVTAEIGKDLTGVTVHALPDRLAKFMPV